MLVSKMNKFFNILVASFLTIIFEPVLGQKCGSGALKKFDLNIAKLLTVATPTRRFPQDNGQELKSYCDESARYLSDMDAYRSKCLKGASKQISGIINYAVKSVFKEICSKNSKQWAKLLPAISCVNQAKVEINQCQMSMGDTFLGIQNERDDKKKVPYMCCEHYKIYPCIRKHMLKKSECNEEKIKIVLDFIRDLFGNTVDMGCADYIEGSEKCEKLGSPPKKRKNQKSYRSFALPLMAILDSFPDV